MAQRHSSYQRNVINRTGMARMDSLASYPFARCTSLQIMFFLLWSFNSVFRSVPYVDWLVEWKSQIAFSPGIDEPASLTLHRPALYKNPICFLKAAKCT